MKWHNNYDLILGNEYEAQKYKKGWLLIEGQLYREDCFEEVVEIGDAMDLKTFNKEINKVIESEWFKEKQIRIADELFDKFYDFNSLDRDEKDLLTSRLRDAFTAGFNYQMVKRSIKL